MIKNWNNIGYEEINLLLSAQNEFISDNELNIVLEKENEYYGQIDQILLSYLILFLYKNDNLKIGIDFKDPIDSNRFFSFSTQMYQIKYLYHFITDDNFTIKGKYTDRKTGEIKSIQNYESSFQSKNFVPPIFIQNEDSVLKYFNLKVDLTKDKILKSYNDKLVDDLKSLIIDNRLSDKDLRDIKEKLNKFYTNHIKGKPFFNVVLLRLFADTDLDLFKKVDKANGGSELKTRLSKKIELLNNVAIFVENLSIGTQELAKNIAHHSKSAGVITIRKFKKHVLQDLKSEDEVTFFDLDSNKEIESFLDINVIDLGIVDIKKNYINNLEASKQVLSSIIEDSFDDNTDIELLEHVKKSVEISFDDDIEIIKKNDYPFHKLFIKDELNGVNDLSIQKNKFISKIGLQYFTAIVKDQYQGFIKVSSLNEKTLMYNKNNLLFCSIKNSESFINYGTFYNCIIPIKNWKKTRVTRSSSNKQTFSQDPNTFDELSQYNFITREESICDRYKPKEKNIIDYKIEFKDTSTKYDNFYNIFIDIIKKQKDVTYFTGNDIIAISCTEIQDKNLTNASDWLRFIWTLDYFFENIILYDIDIKHFKSIVALRKVFSHESEINFWNDDSRILFYSKKINDNVNEYYRYGANLLAGKDLDEYEYLNTKIWRHHYSFKGDNLFKLYNEPPTEAMELSPHLNSVLFSKKGNLHYYEVLLSTSTTNENQISLFEKSVQYSLNTPLEEKQIKNTNNKGYKIENTHFRLGSKIHISDFYYAKKLFQNSFFTTPLAYKIANNIWNTYFIDETGNLLEDKIEHSFTIVGYENYSSFLISSIRNFIKRKNEYENISINHLTIDKDAQLSRERHKLKENVLIVVPIASTFNTSLKIEDQLNDIAKRANQDEILRFEKIKVIEPIQNVVLVAHRGKDESKFLEQSLNEDNSITEETIFKEYNWKKADIDEKTITIERYNFTGTGTITEKERRQKYLVPVYTEWEKAKECKFCFPNNKDYERCLIETGKASITPQVIFGFPKTKEYHSILGNLEPPVLSLEGSLLYGSLKNRDNKYLYFNRTGKIIEDNSDEIENWIINLKDKIKSQPKLKNDLLDKKVVIITPNTGSRSRFLDMINELLFDYTANCIIISLKEDYIENAETLYSDGLHNAETILYVDDVLSTGKSFIEANYIIKYIRDKNQLGEGINYCISLINRMAYADEENLLLKLKTLNTESSVPAKDRLIYYYKINNPTIEEANKKFPLSIERGKYEFLERNSSLDAIRKYFNDKRLNIKPHNLKKSPPTEIKDYSLAFERRNKKRNKKLFQLLVLNAMYSIFKYHIIEYDKNLDIVKYRDKKSNYEKGRIKNDLRTIFPKIEKDPLLNDTDTLKLLDAEKLLRKKVLEELEKDYKHKRIIQDNEHNLDNVILKVICSTPLIYYKPIRETSFYWVLLRLRKKIEEIETFKTPIEFYQLNSQTGFSSYQDIKFLLKKSVKLNSNFIIHKSTFDFFEKLIFKLEKINSKDSNKMKSSNSKFFNKLQQICKKEDYLAIPTIKLKQYDFIQNNLKDKVFEKIEFDSVYLTSEGIYNDTALKNCLTKQEETIYHKKLIKKYNLYRNEVEKKDLLKIDLPLIKTQDAKVWTSFEKDIKKLMTIPRYKKSSSKNLVTHIIALIQELVYQHETKSIRLDKLIDEIQSVYKHDNNSNENGTYVHLIRLLHLENIEIINKYANELIHKFKNEIKEEKQLSIDGINQNLNLKYIGAIEINKIVQSDKKYEELCIIQNEDIETLSSIDSFLSLKDYLEDLTKETNGDEDKIQDKIKAISTKLSNIIGSDLVDNIFFTINYKDFENYNKDDIYTFSLFNCSDNQIELLNDENSLSSLMGNELFKTADGDVFSHFEIMKENGKVNCRDIEVSFKAGNFEQADPIDKVTVRIEDVIKETKQFEQLGDDKSILLIRLSDFRKEKGKRKDKDFNTLGVITIYLKKAKRLEQKKLRLLLALRHDLNRFIKKKTLGTTFLELLQIKEKDELKRLLKHSIRTYLTNQSTIYQDLLTQPENIEKVQILQILNNAIGGQTDNFEIIPDILKYEKKELSKYLIKLLETDFLGNGIKNYDIDIRMDFINLHKTIYDVIIPELIYNLKKYTPFRKSEKGVSILIENNQITFINNINRNRQIDRNSGEGLKMCNRILAFYSENNYVLTNEIEQKDIFDQFIVKLQIG